MKDTLLSLLEQRILVLDGAMGTMIQRHKLQEKDYRGTRFATHSHPLMGNNDILVLTRPDIIYSLHFTATFLKRDLTLSKQTRSMPTRFHRQTTMHPTS